MSAPLPIGALTNSSTYDITGDRCSRLLETAFYHNKVGNISTAKKACEEVLKLNPQSTTAHSLLASIYEQQGDTDRAIEHRALVLMLNPTSEADALKLEELRNGIHTPPKPTPEVPWHQRYRGLNGAVLISQLSWNKLRERRYLPVAASVLVALLLLSAAALVIHNGSAPKRFASVNDVRFGAPGSMPVVDRPSVAPHSSGFPPSQLSAFANAPEARHQPVSAVQADPFTEHIANLSGPRVAYSPGTGGAYTRPRGYRSPYSDAVTPLPPLNLRAVPNSAISGLQPAPVAVPQNGTANGYERQDTVVVSQIPQRNSAFTNTSEFSNMGNSAPQAAQPNNEYASHVHITVEKPGDAASKDVQGTLIVGNSSALDEASSYQQSALGMQQDSDYKHAATLYRKAIAQYRSAINSGQGGDTAARGLKACQTGLDICQQSQ